MLFAQALTLRKNLVTAYIYHPSHYPDLLTWSVVIISLAQPALWIGTGGKGMVVPDQVITCAPLAPRITSAGIMKDGGPMKSGNCLSCRFKTLAPLEEYAS